MAKDFFENLSETLTKTARDLGDRAGEVYEQQRLRNKISGEEKQIEKAMADLGRIIYGRYNDNVPLDEEERTICEKIDQRKRQIAQYNDELTNLKSKYKRICPSCGAIVGKSAAFCSQCGAACLTQETESDVDDDVIDGTAKDITDTDDVEETVTEPADDVTEENIEATPAEETTEEASEDTEE